MVIPYYSHSNPIAIPYRTDVADVSLDEWLQVHTPLITAADCEGAGEMRLNWSIDRCVRNGIFMGNMMIFMRKTMTFMRTMMSLWGTWWFLWASDSFFMGKNDDHTWDFGGVFFSTESTEVPGHHNDDGCRERWQATTNGGREGGRTETPWDN